ncbi:MAG: hypothetical protein PVJ73_16450, partial [Acidobacteriota bacterium]
VRAGLVGVLALSLLPGVALPQATDPAPRPAAKIKSMGQPLRFKPYLAGEYAWNRDLDTTGGYAVAGVYKDVLFPPVSGALGLSLEGYGGGSGRQTDGGARFFITTKLLFLGFGWDWNFRENRRDGIIAFTPYLRRGGLLGQGGNFRIEWLPSRHNSWRFGFQLPLEPHMGKTRQKVQHVTLPKPALVARSLVPEEAFDALEDLRHAGLWLVANTNLFSDEDDASYFHAMAKFQGRLERVQAAFNQTDAEHPEGHTHVQESQHYHEALDRAFTAAVGPERGPGVADLARGTLLDEVLLPYDRLIGRFKKPNTVLGFAATARLRLGQALDQRGGLNADQRGAALATFDRLLDLVERARRLIHDHWEGDERKVWLPLTLAVRDEDHDEQAELNGLIERALQRPFEPGNAVLPTSNARFQIELVRSIRAAEDYHVLWIHDYAGRVGGEPDSVAHAVSIQYLKALARHVREYDETGRLPTFMIFHTQFFYDGSGSRLFLTLLENPLDHRLKLGKKHRNMEQEVEEAQEGLRQAVAGSKRLQAEAREKGVDGWIRDVVKVNVSVTYPADLSFRTTKLVEWLPFAPDSLMLDHRKLFFYDVTEEDPRKGEACFTGTGVGSEYAGPTWDDRGILVSGPSLLELKSAARRLLRSQGFAEDEIPPDLQPKARPANYDMLVKELEEGGRDAPGLNVHNEVGFAPKENTLVQAIIYTMAPADTLLVVPDSIWASPLWAGQLVGAALRGCHVYPVAPSQDNAPAAGLAVLARTREIFGRLFEAGQVLKEEIERAGGHLRVGLYTRSARSDDNLSLFRDTARRLRKNRWLIEEFPMPRNIVTFLDEEADKLEDQGYEPYFIAPGTREGRPKMHRKTQFFSTRRALRATVDLPMAVEGLRHYLDVDSKGTADPLALLDKDTPLGPRGPVLTRLETDPPPGAKDAVFFLTVGSKNQDPRSAFLDGENSYVVAGPWTIAYYPGFLFLMANTTWIEEQAQLDELISVEEKGARKLGRMIRKVL